MSVAKKSIVKGTMLAIAVIIAGISLGTIFLSQQVSPYPPVNLDEWAQDETVIFPRFIEIFPTLWVPSHPPFSGNTMAFRVNYNATGNNDWLLACLHSGRKNTTLFLLSQNDLINVSNALKETVLSALTGEELSYEEYYELAKNDRPGVITRWNGMDGVAIYIDILPGGIGVYTSYEYGSTYNARYYYLSTESYEDALQISYIQVWNATLQTLFDGGT